MKTFKKLTAIVMTAMLLTSNFCYAESLPEEEDARYVNNVVYQEGFTEAGLYEEAVSSDFQTAEDQYSSDVSSAVYLSNDQQTTGNNSPSVAEDAKSSAPASDTVNSSTTDAKTGNGDSEKSSQETNQNSQESSDSQSNVETENQAESTPSNQSGIDETATDENESDSNPSGEKSNQGSGSTAPESGSSSEGHSNIFVYGAAGVGFACLCFFLMKRFNLFRILH